MLNDYPPVGFHFVVAFQLLPQTPVDVSFQEVSGLTVEMEMETYVEGGENRFTHQLPTRTRYSDLTLKRGLPGLSGVSQWVKDAVENFKFQPINLTVSLLNADHIPLNNWYVVNAIPKRWEVSGFNAEQNSVVIETLVLSFNTIKPFNLNLSNAY